MSLSVGELESMLFSTYGDTGWWPADSADEVIIGAILTQNTAWKNVEIALANLSKNEIYSLSDLEEVELELLAKCIKSSGFYNQKAKSLKRLSSAIMAKYGGIDDMKLHSLDELQAFLRAIIGVGQETMDAILLYALEKPVFVVDKYTLRIFGRTGVVKEPSISSAKEAVKSEIGSDLKTLSNLHGMIVYLAKDYCRMKPICDGCPLVQKCDFASEKKGSKER